MRRNQTGPAPQRGSYVVGIASAYLETPLQVGTGGALESQREMTQ